MVQKVYLIENLDCANCAAKIEAKFNALPEVEAATITFATRQLRLTAENPDALLEKLTALARTVESEVEIHPCSPHHHSHRHAEHGYQHEHHEDCGCKHNHQEHHHEGCSCGHDHHGHHHEHHHGSEGDDKKTLLLGAALFAGGLLLNLADSHRFGFIAFLGAYVVLGHQIIAAAWKNLRNGHVLDENFLMSIASLGAFFIGEAAEAVGVILFYCVGEYFEDRAVARSRSQIMDAVDLRPEVVILEGGKTIPAEDAKIGDILIVRPGDRIPLDGIILHGESRIDTAPITGEPVPVSVQAGDSIISGCVNTSGQLIIRVTHPLSESMVTRILNSAENAAASKPKLDRFITRFARVYTPVVVALAAAVAIVPSLITSNWNYWIYTALSFLVMSCPCALVLSVPLAFFSGIGTGSKQGILFKGGASMEALSSIKAVVMDKTGTLTRGDFRVQEIHGGDAILKAAASCEQYSTHPIGISILQAAKEHCILPEYPEKIEEIAGRGIKAVLGGREILCGSEKLMRDHGIVLPGAFDGAGTRVFVAVDGAYKGDLLIADTLKPEARSAVSRLKQQGLSTAMLTGDNEESAAAIAAETGINEVYARLLPDEKLTALQQLRTAKGAVMYVGDGINDAPVLAGADVGAAMGSGADAAIEAADVVFMTSSVDAIGEAVDIARATRQIALQNIVFALAVKAVVMVLGLAGYASMWMAVFADSGVAMLCVLNSIRLLYRKK
ncbi:MAG: cadmium-translocating P-type ATPase [Oscillospiraceae bacterium]|nr:cadmium-translocating P-type ATPase [Oscillospiraceae bacterium]